MEGFITLHRHILDVEKNPTMQDNDYFALWVRLLLMACHKDQKFFFNKRLIKLQRGQLVTGRRKLAEYSQLSQSKIEKILKCFENEQQIKQEGFSKYRVITITNYDKYQSGEQQVKQQTNSKRTADEQQTNTYNNVKQCITNKHMFNFDQIYAAYPKKVGKKKGFLKCKKVIKSDEDFGKLQKAVENYGKSVAGTEIKYVKQFDTFMGVWEDYVELEASPEVSAPKSNQIVDRIIQNVKNYSRDDPSSYDLGEDVKSIVGDFGGWSRLCSANQFDLNVTFRKELQGIAEAVLSK